MGEAKRRREHGVTTKGGLSAARRRELEQLLDDVALVRRNLAKVRAEGVTTMLTPPLDESGRRINVLDGETELWCDCTEATVRAQLEGRAPTAEEVALAERVWGPGILEGRRLVPK